MTWIFIIIPVIVYIFLINHLVKLVKIGKLDEFKIISKGASWVLIPIILAIIGFFIQNAVKEREINTKYVEFALNIFNRNLSDNPTTEEVELRLWAIDTINHYSDIKLHEIFKNETMKKRIFRGEGKMTLPKKE